MLMTTALRADAFTQKARIEWKDKETKAELSGR